MYEVIALVSIIILTLVSKIFIDRSAVGISNKSAYLLFKLIALGGGLFLVYINLGQFHDYQKKQSWHSKNGEIISFEIVGDKTKEPEIGYIFVVNGDTLEGKTNLQTPLFGSRRYQEQTARTISGNYHIGDSVKVYYNPENPAESVLSVRPVWSLYIQFTFAVIVISIVLALLISPKSREENKDESES